MIHKLRRRFIAFTMLVMSVILGILMLVVGISTQNSVTHHRALVMIVVMLVLVFLGSVMISKMAIAPIKKSWQRQIDFTADASHELRTPLAIMQSNLEIVIDNPQEQVKSQEKWLKVALKENERMKKLVEDLLTLSRADTGMDLLEQEEMPLDLLINERVAAFKTLAADKQIVIITAFKEDLMLWGDVHRINQLLTILLDNAIKYMNRPGEIRIRAEKKGNKIHLSIHDTGEGMRPEEVKQVFTRFYRVDRARSSKTEGSGLGLAIAKWIVESHQGCMKLRSTWQEGTYIDIIL